MTVLLALITVVAFGIWIPIAQAVPGIPQRSRTFYVAAGNVVLATIALGTGGGHLSFGWRGFWLPLAGGVVWTVGSFAAFRSSSLIGLSRAAGTWTPLNIITAFVWGALLFHELRRFTDARFALLGVGLVAVLIGVILIVRSRDADPTEGTNGSAGVGSFGQGLIWGLIAGVMWGSYFIPAQWARIPAQVADFPLALGILAAGLVLVAGSGDPVLLRPKIAAVQLTAGFLFGVGNLTLLGLVARVGTGVGFTIAQLSLLVNAGVGMWVFKVPRPGSGAARSVLAGILIAGLGGVLVGTLK
jgi:glucose uptake protein GlcU